MNDLEELAKRFLDERFKRRKPSPVEPDEVEPRATDEELKKFLSDNGFDGDMIDDHVGEFENAVEATKTATKFTKVETLKRIRQHQDSPVELPTLCWGLFGKIKKWDDFFPSN